MEQYKTCITCKQDKPESDFKVCKTKCHDCYKQYHKDYQRSYRETTRDAENQRSRELYQQNKAKILERKRKRYHADPEKNIRKKLSWQKANPVLCRLSSQRRRASLRNNGIFEIIEKDSRRLAGSACFYCGAKTKQMTFDHVVPIAKGGRHSIGNLVSACKPCNSSKNDKFIVQWKVTKR